MSWKDISKSSYTVESVKFTLARPSHPFTIPYQGPKIRYSEGDEVTSVSDYRFNLDFTGEPLDDRHFPCGYWHKNYIPPFTFTIIYTSLLYPLEVTDSLEIDTSIISGEFYVNFFLESYDNGIESLNLEGEIIGGVFRSVLILYSHSDYMDIDTTITAGVFRLAIKSYTYPTESLNLNCTIQSGVFRDTLIEYGYWPYEGLNLTTSIISGTHNA